VIPDSKKHRERPKREELVIDEILPRTRQIFCDVERIVRSRGLVKGFIILVEPVDRAKVSQVPIELCPVSGRSVRDGRHHDVTAISGIA